MLARYVLVLQSQFEFYQAGLSFARLVLVWKAWFPVWASVLINSSWLNNADLCKF